MNRLLVLAGTLFALVVALTLIRPPAPSHPQLEFNTPDGLNGQVLLAAQPSATFCRDVGTPIARALEGACPACKVTPLRCLPALSERQQDILGGQSPTGYSVRLPAGVMLLRSADPQLAKGACEAVAAQGLGVCLGEGGRAGLLAPQNLQQQPVMSWVQLAGVAALPFLASLALGLLIVFGMPLHGRWTADYPGSGVQKLHVRLVPRVGGLALMAGAAAPLIWPMWGDDLLMSLSMPFGQGQVSVASVLKVLLLASLPAFVFGLAEDLTRRVGVRERLLATMASALLAWWLTGFLIERLDLGVLDAVMSVAAISLAFTALAVAGVANAMNIIDGVHGLASGVGAFALMALGVLAWMVGDRTMAVVCALLVGATVGFFVLNFPFGRLFLGDGGAYVLGFWIAWISVMLVGRNPDVSPWACLLIVAYPVTEVLYSVKRRLSAKLHPSEPDLGHLHSLVKTRWMPSRFGRFGPDLQNAAVSPGLWLLAVAPMGIAVLGHEMRVVLIAGTVVFVVVYAWLHRRVGEMDFPGGVGATSEPAKP